MSCYSADIKHTEESITAFTKAQFSIYDAKRRRTLLSVGALLLLGGVLVSSHRAISVLMLFFGCLVFIHVANIPVQTAKLMLRANPEPAAIRFFFTDGGITAEQAGKRSDTPYEKLEALADDGRYLHLFLGERNAYTFARASVKPDDIADFKRFLQDKTGLHWQRPGSILSSRLTGLRSVFGRRA